MTDLRMPFVSIIITCYNYARYVSAAIESAVEQDYSNIEVLVVDDGSTDESREVIGRYKDGIQIHLQENGGVAAALNSGYSVSRGEIIFFLDADDVLEREAVSEVVKNWRDDTSKAHFLLEVIDENGQKQGITVPTARMPEGDVRKRVLQRADLATPPMSGHAFSRKALRDVFPIDTRIWRKNADTLLIFEAALNGPVVAIREPLGRFRVHDANLTTSFEQTWKGVQANLEADSKIERHIVAWAARRGCAIAEHPKLMSYQHLKNRLIQARLWPGSSTGETLAASQLAVLGVRACVTDEYLPRTARILMALWFIVMAMMPKVASRAIINASCSPTTRGNGLNRRIRGTSGV